MMTYSYIIKGSGHKKIGNSLKGFWIATTKNQSESMYNEGRFLAVFACVAAALAWNVCSLHCIHYHITGHWGTQLCYAVQCFHTCSFLLRSKHNGFLTKN